MGAERANSPAAEHSPGGPAGNILWWSVAALLVAMIGLGWYVTTPKEWEIPLEMIPSMAVHPQDARLLVAFREGVYEARPGGWDAWRPAFAVPDAEGLFIHPRDPGRMYVVGHKAGLIRSVDGGRTWERLLEATVPSADVHTVALDAADPARLWAYVAGWGIYYSADGGDTWEQMSDVNKQIHIYTMLKLPEGGDTLLIGGGGGMQISRDAGRTWAPFAVSLDKRVVTALQAIAGDSRRLGAVVGVKWLMLSEDGGVSWQRIPTPPIARDDLLLSLTVDPRDPSRLFLGTWRGQLFTTSDTGSTWQAWSQ